MNNTEDLEEWYEKIREREIARFWEIMQVRAAIDNLKKARKRIEEWGFVEDYKKAFSALLELLEVLKFEDAK